jgi:membrane protease YdiL (CAAX protease family)
VRATAAAAAGAAGAWALLVSASPPWFFLAAGPLCAAWIALSARAAPPGLAARLRPRAGDLGAGLALALVLFAGTRAVLWTGCGGVTDALCAPVAAMFARFQTRTPLAGIVLVAVVAPAEELFWRGFVQRRLERRLGRWRAAAASAAAYGGAHVVTGNLTLTGAAGVAGAYWSALAAMGMPMAALVVSHVAWDVWIFLLSPTGPMPAA